MNNNIDRPTQTTQQESKRYCVTHSVTLFSLFELLDARFPVLAAETFPDRRSPNVSGSINITCLSDVREPFKIIMKGRTMNKIELHQYLITAPYEEDWSEEEAMMLKGPAFWYDCECFALHQEEEEDTIIF